MASKNEITSNRSNGLPPVNNLDTTGLSEDQQKYVEAGILASQRILSERNEAWRSINKLTEQIAALKAEISALQALSAAMESRATSFQNSRDEAVARRAEYEVLLRSIMAQLREFNVQHEPLIQPENKQPYVEVDGE